MHGAEGQAACLPPAAASPLRRAGLGPRSRREPATSRRSGVVARWPFGKDPSSAAHATRSGRNLPRAGGSSECLHEHPSGVGSPGAGPLNVKPATPATTKESSMKLGRIPLGCAVAPFLAAAAVAVAPVQAATVKVGVVLTYSGGGAELGTQIDRGLELFLKENPDAFGGHTVELIKRDSKRPGRRHREERGPGAGHPGRGGPPHRVRLLPERDRERAARDPGQGADGRHERGNGLDPEALAVHRPGLLHHVARGLSDGELRARQARVQDRRRGLHRLPAGQGQPQRVPDRLRGGRRHPRRGDPDGRPARGAGLHALLPADQGRGPRLLLRLRAGPASTPPQSPKPTSRPA